MTKKKKHKHSLLIVLRFFKNKIVMRNSFSCKLEVCTVHSIYQPYLITPLPPPPNPPPLQSSLKFLSSIGPRELLLATSPLLSQFISMKRNGRMNERGERVDGKFPSQLIYNFYVMQEYYATGFSKGGQ